MKKLVLLLVVMLIPAVCFSAGFTSNAFVKWFNLSSTQTLNLPYDSRNIWIRNGSETVSVCVGVSNGASMNQTCDTATGLINLDPNSEVYLNDYVTSKILLAHIGPVAASPVTVVVTY